MNQSLSEQPWMKKGLDTLGLTDRQWNALLDYLDEEAVINDPHKEQRQSERFTHRYPVQIGIAVKQPGGSISRFLVRGRDLSSGGIGFLHGSFLYPNNTCSGTLKTTAGEDHPFTGTVRRCEHLTGKIHLVGVQFDTPIPIEDFL